MYTFKPITDPESMFLLEAAGLLWYRDRGSPTYELLSSDGFDYKEWGDGLVSEGVTLSEDGKFRWPNGWWLQHAIREEH